MVELIDRQSALSVCKEYCWLDDDDFIEGYNTAIKDMREAIKELPTVNRWIPCGEQMMPDGERVLVCLTNGEVFVMTRSKDVISDGLRHLTDLSAVVRWMPIPDTYEPPESEVKDDDEIRD